MLVLLERTATRGDAERVAAHARELRFHAEVIGGAARWAVAVSGGIAAPPASAFEGQPGVARVDPSPNACLLASREFHEDDTVVDVGGVAVGGGRVVLMAGPCAIESDDQLWAVAERVKKAGATVLRAGAWKLRTSPWSFQGLEARALGLLGQVREGTGLRIVTEVVSETTLGAVAAVADLVQVGARNMKNYELLKHVGRCGRPVLLKRGSDATVSELLLAAEYLLAAGAPGVILCERGIRTFADHARNTLDLSMVPAVRKLSHLPIVVDPSHGTGSRDLVTPLARAAIAVGADGLLVEVHPRPEEALSDGPQALRPEDFDRLAREVEAVARAVGRSL